MSVESMAFFTGVLDGQEKSGLEMRNDSYYTDPFHPGGAHNVGEDVLNAVAVMRQAGEDLLASGGDDMTAVLLRLSTLKGEYAAQAEDPGGYGAAAFNSVITALCEWSASHGYAAGPSAEELMQSAAFLGQAEMYAQGSEELLDDLANTYRLLAPRARGHVDAVLERQLRVDGKRSALVALKTVDLIRRFYQAVGEAGREVPLFREKQELLILAEEELQRSSRARSGNADADETRAGTTGTATTPRPRRKRWWQFW